MRVLQAGQPDEAVSLRLPAGQRSLQVPLGAAVRDRAQNGGAWDYAFTPTPEGRYVAFASNRTSATDDRQGPSGAAPDGLDLWIAESVDKTEPIDPTKSYEKLVKCDAASAPMVEDLPSWISDDARTLFFSSRRLGGADVFVTSRKTSADAFGPAERVGGVSASASDDDGFSLPSIAALAASGGKGWAWVRRTDLLQRRRYYRVPVCLGAP